MIAARRQRHPPRDPLPNSNLDRGDVVQRGGQVGVVADCSGDRVLLWPVRWEVAERVADIPVTGWLDGSLLGEGARDRGGPRRAMVQAGVLLDAPLVGQRRLGRVTDGLLGLIERAAARHAQTTATFRRWAGERKFRSDRTAPPKAF